MSGEEDEPNYVYITRQFTLDKSSRDTAFLDTLMERAGTAYTDIKDRSCEAYEEDGETLDSGKLYKKVIRGNCSEYKLHSQTLEEKCQRYRNALKGYFEKLNSDIDYDEDELKPPYKDKEAHPVKWKDNGIDRKDDGTVKLKNGGFEDRKIEFNLGEYEHFDIRTAELFTRNNQYILSFTFKVKTADEMVSGDGLAAIDFGEVHPMTVYNGKEVFIFNGGELRSKFRWFNKEHGKIQRKLERREEGSNRYEQALNERKQLLNRFQNQVKDILDKYIAKLVDTLLEDGVSTLAIGDLTGIRQGLDYGSYVNQKIHQFCFARLKSMLETQCKKRGITVEEVDEAHTSSTCPDCGERQSPNKRNFHCSDCGLEYHRDGIAAVNIFKRWCSKNNQMYPGCARVVAEMAPATGIRYSPEMTCWTLSERKSESILRHFALTRQVTKSEDGTSASDSVVGSTA